jgi:flagellar FliL protein
MAEKKEAESEEQKDEDKGKGSKKLIIIIAIVVLLVVVGGVGAFLALGKSKTSEDGEATEEAADEDEEGGEHGQLPGAVLPLESFIVNLQVKGSFLKTTMQLEFATPALPHSIDRDIPKIRDAIIRIISAKAAADILSVEGKEKLRDEVKRAVNEALKSEDVTNVYLTEFIIQ